MQLKSTFMVLSALYIWHVTERTVNKCSLFMGKFPGPMDLYAN